MEQTSKMILVAFVAALLAGGGVFLWQQNESPSSPLVEIQEQIAQYNCEQSGGTFAGSSCTCPIEEGLGQTQEMMYDENTGYCQTTFGGPGGEVMQQMQISYGRKLELDTCLKKLATYKTE